MSTSFVLDTSKNSYHIFSFGFVSLCNYFANVLYSLYLNCLSIMEVIFGPTACLKLLHEDWT